MNTCGRLDEHAKERKSFTKQAYAPGLKGPGPLGRIDFGNPALKPMLRMMADNMKKDTRAYHPPEGLRLRSLSVDNGNGRQIWCFVMEPEGEETRSLPGMLYCHGGGFFLPLQVPALRLAAKYAAALGIPARHYFTRCAARAFAHGLQRVGGPSARLHRTAGNRHFTR